MTTKYRVQFSGNEIETTVTKKASVVDEWIGAVRSIYNRQQITVGLDCEWKPHAVRGCSNKTATMQLCVGNKCLIIQMFYLDYIPQSIKGFFSDANVKFVGVEVGGDAIKLRTEYGISVVSTADIQAMAMQRWPVKFYRKPGLKSLARELVGLHMEKPLHVCTSNWEARNLSVEQVEYACIDAYASYRIGHKLADSDFLHDDMEFEDDFHDDLEFDNMISDFLDEKEFEEQNFGYEDFEGSCFFGYDEYGSD